MGSGVARGVWLGTVVQKVRESEDGQCAEGATEKREVRPRRKATRGEPATESGPDESTRAEESVEGGHDRAGITFLHGNSLGVHAHIEAPVTHAEEEQCGQQGPEARSERQDGEQHRVDEYESLRDPVAAEARGEATGQRHRHEGTPGHRQQGEAEHAVVEAKGGLDRRDARHPTADQRAVDEEQRRHRKTRGGR